MLTIVVNEKLERISNYLNALSRAGIHQAISMSGDSVNLEYDKFTRTINLAEPLATTRLDAAIKDIASLIPTNLLMESCND